MNPTNLKEHLIMSVSPESMSDSVDLFFFVGSKLGFKGWNLLNLDCPNIKSLS